MIITKMNTVQEINNTLNQTMSLLDLNYQINKLSTKAIIEWVRKFGSDLSNDIMKGIRNMHQEGKEAPSDPEMMFNMFQEIIQDALEERIELLKLDIPKKKPGRVSKKKKTSIKDVIAVEDSDDEAPKKRGRKAIVVTANTTSDDMNAMGLKTTARKSKTLKKKTPAFKVFRRIEKMVEKPKGSGKFKKAVPWRNPTYKLKEGEKWLDSWSISDKAPKKGSVTFDHKPTDEELSSFQATVAVEKKPAAVEKKPAVVEKKPAAVEKKPEVVEKKPALKKQPTLIENPEEVKNADNIKATVKELVNELEEDNYEEEEEEELNTPSDSEEFTVSNFTPAGEYLPFTAMDNEDNLIYYTDTSIKQYGLIIDSKTGEHKGWIANEDADEMVDNKPTYEHEEEDNEEDWESMCDGGVNIGF